MYRSHVGRWRPVDNEGVLSNLEGGAMTRMVDGVPEVAVWHARTGEQSRSRRADRRHGGLCCGQRLAYHFGFSGELRMRLTADRDIRKVRAISAAFTPALNDARMRFAVPSGICSIPPILSLRVLADWLGDDALVGAAAAALRSGPP